jgi:hypothetical protein
LPGSPNTGRPPTIAKQSGFAGRIATWYQSTRRGVGIVGRDTFERVAHVVEVAHRHPAARHHRVAAGERAFERRGHGGLVVAGDPEVDRDDARAFEEREQHGAVAVADLAGLEGARLDQLVTRGEHTDACAWIHEDSRHIDPGKHAEMGGT